MTAPHNKGTCCFSSVVASTISPLNVPESIFAVYMKTLLSGSEDTIVCASGVDGYMNTYTEQGVTCRMGMGQSNRMEQSRYTAERPLRTYL